MIKLRTKIKFIKLVPVMLLGVLLVVVPVLAFRIKFTTSSRFFFFFQNWFDSTATFFSLLPHMPGESYEITTGECIVCFSQLLIL